jgi:signal peptidase I
MTANEPPNPYAATAAPLADASPDAAPPPTQPAPSGVSRPVALLVALFSFPPGVGLYLRGRPRRFAFWATTGVSLYALMIVAIRIPWPRLALAAIGGAVLIGLLPLVDTVLARPGGARLFAKPWLVAIMFIALGLSWSFAVRRALVEAFQIPSAALMPTLLVGDHILVRKGSRGVARGDVIVFEFPLDTNTDYIKRVVAVGGDTVEVRGGVPTINGVPLVHDPIDAPCDFQDPSDPSPGPERCTLVRETNAGRSYPIMLTPDHPAADAPPIILGADELFVMGDNRDNSYDSRRWGAVRVRRVKGTATMIWWSKEPHGPARWSRIGRAVE